MSDDTVPTLKQTKTANKTTKNKTKQPEETLVNPWIQRTWRSILNSWLINFIATDLTQTKKKSKQIKQNELKTKVATQVTAAPAQESDDEQVANEPLIIQQSILCFPSSYFSGLTGVYTSSDQPVKRKETAHIEDEGPRYRDEDEGGDQDENENENKDVDEDAQLALLHRYYMKPDFSRYLQVDSAFAEDDIHEEFDKLKEQSGGKKKTELSLGLPGWGSWGGEGIVPKEPNSVPKTNNTKQTKQPQAKPDDTPNKPSTPFNTNKTNKTNKSSNTPTATKPNHTNTKSLAKQESNQKARPANKDSKPNINTNEPPKKRPKILAGRSVPVIKDDASILRNN